MYAFSKTVAQNGLRSNQSITFFLLFQIKVHPDLFSKIYYSDLSELFALCKVVRVLAFQAFRSANFCFFRYTFLSVTKVPLQLSTFVGTTCNCFKKALMYSTCGKTSMTPPYLQEHIYLQSRPTTYCNNQPCKLLFLSKRCLSSLHLWKLGYGYDRILFGKGVLHSALSMYATPPIALNDFFRSSLLIIHSALSFSSPNVTALLYYLAIALCCR